MDTLVTQLNKLHQDESAVALTEYIILLSLIAAFGIMVIALLDREVAGLYREVHDGLSNGQIQGGMSTHNTVSQN